MPYQATVYRILIGGPSDTEEFKIAAYELINEWNSLNSERRHTVLLPVRWEIDTYASFGGHPQTIANDQAVDGCDAMIAIFRDKLGTPTESNISGTVEELERVHSAGKEVGVYLYEGPADRKRARESGFQRLEEFKKGIKDRGLHQEFEDIRTFERRFDRHITHLADLFSTSSMLPTQQMSNNGAAVDELLTVVRRHHNAWKALELSEPVGIKDGVTLLGNLGRDITSLDLESGGASEPSQSQLISIASQINKLQRHQLFMDGGQSYREFWRGGSEVLERLNSFANALQHPEQEQVSLSTTSDYEQQRRRARIVVEWTGRLELRGHEVHSTFLLSNLGQYEARIVHIQVMVPDEPLTTLDGPLSLSSGERREYRFRLTRELVDSVDTNVIVQMQFEDGTGTQAEQFILQIDGSIPTPKGTVLRP